MIFVAAAACDDEPGTTAPDVATDMADDVTEDAQEDGREDEPDVSPDGWIDGSYTDGSETPPPENCTDGEDNDGDEQTDCADTDCSSRLVCSTGQTAEEEPNQRSEDGQLLTLPVLVAGDIGAYTESGDGERDDDIDWYRFEIEGPMLIDWEFDDANGPALPILTLVGLEDANRGVVRQLDVDTPGDRRQTYLPVAGQYGVEVRDRRNLYAGNDELPYGDDSFDYAMRIEEVAIEAEAQTLPITRSPAQFGENNALPIFEVALTTGSVFEAEVWAERLEPSSAMNVWLHLVNEADLALIASADNAPLGTADPILRTWRIEEDLTALLIVDAYRVDFGSDYEMFADLIEPSQDREPNNPIGLAYPAFADDVIEGRVEEPMLRFRNIVTDADYYYYLGGRSASYVVEVTPQGADLDASVRTGYLSWNNYGAYLAEIFLADPPDTRGVRLEATSLANTWLWVEVNDRRNHLVEDAEPVGGGTGFDYELRVTGFSRTLEPAVLPLSTTGELSLLGEVDWYEFSAPIRTRVQIRAEEQTEGVEPYVYLAYDNDDYIRRASRELCHLNNKERTYRLGVVDRRAGGGDTYDYDLTVEALAHTDIVESEPNDGPPIGGQVLGTPPVWVDATLTGTNEEDFDVDVFIVSLEAGDTVFFETGAGIDQETDNANTTMRVIGPSLDEPIEDSSSGHGWYAAVLELEVPATGSYEVEVWPWCNRDRCSVGDYSLAIWVE